MSRLQVGGLALIINDNVHENIGKTVTLDAYAESQMNDKHELFFDTWDVSCSDGILFSDGSIEHSGVFCNSRDLMPLGDKQTQQEFRKEQDLCHEN